MHVFRECLSKFARALFFLFWFRGGMWDLIVLIPDHCLSVYLMINPIKVNNIAYHIICMTKVGFRFYDDTSLNIIL